MPALFAACVAAISMPAESSLSVSCKRTCEAHIPASGAARSRSEQRRDPSRVCDRIIVQCRDKVGLRCFDALIHGSPKSDIRCVLDYPRGTRRRQQCMRARPDPLLSTTITSKSRSDCAFERSQTVRKGRIRRERRNHNRNDGWRQSSVYRAPRFSYHRRFCVAEPMQVTSMRLSPFRSSAVHAAAAMSPSSRGRRFHVEPSTRRCTHLEAPRDIRR